MSYPQLVGYCESGNKMLGLLKKYSGIDTKIILMVTAKKNRGI